MRIFGHIVLQNIMILLQMFAVTVFVLKWQGSIDWSWGITLLPTAACIVVKSVLTIVIEAISGAAKLAVKAIDLENARK